MMYDKIDLLDLPGDLLNSRILESSLVLPSPPPSPPAILPPQVRCKGITMDNHLVRWFPNVTCTKFVKLIKNIKNLSSTHFQDLISSAVDLLKNSKSPLIIVGKGAAYRRAEYQVIISLVLAVT